MGEAFKPLGVYINFFQPTLRAGSSRRFKVMLVNDYARPVRGTLDLTLQNETGKTVAQVAQPFSMTELGDQSVELALDIPKITGKCTLKATARPDSRGETTISRRWVSVGD